MGLKTVSKKDFDSVLKELEREDLGKVSAPEDSDDSKDGKESGYIVGLDSFEFLWNKQHALRSTYVKLKREMYAKYECLNHTNVDLKVLIDEILVLKTQLSGVGRMMRDGQGPKNLAFRVSKHQQSLLQLMNTLMKYTRKEPEKDLKKTVINKGKKLANELKGKLPDNMRASIGKKIQEMLNAKYDGMTETRAPFEKRAALDVEVEDEDEDD